MTSLAGRVAALEARQRTETPRSYVVEWLPGETPEQAIARTAPTGAFFLVPAQSASMDEWSREALEVLAA